MSTNNYLPFCETDTGTNLETQAEYLADPNRVIGNQPGLASSKFVNKAIRQSSMITSQFAQALSDGLGQNVLDDGNTAKLLAQIKQYLQKTSPVFQKFASSGSYNPTYVVTCSSANATSGATYSDGTTTFTISKTVAASTTLWMTGATDPVLGGTLTKASGTGDATIAFTTFAKPTYAVIKLAGSGAGGAGSGTSGASDGADGTAAVFGTLSAPGGAKGRAGGSGGNGGSGATINSPYSGYELPGSGGGGSSSSSVTGLFGGSNALFGGGTNGTVGGAGSAAANNTGAGGGGGGSSGGTAVGGGGGAGCSIYAILNNPSGTITVTIPTGGSGGAAGVAGQNGGAGGSAYCVVEEHYA